jgi:hypothetical protein
MQEEFKAQETDSTDPPFHSILLLERKGGFMK